MNAIHPRGLLTILVIGDLVTLFFVTLFGFASHSGLTFVGTRFLTTFFPLLFGWAVAAPFMGAYRLDWVSQLRQLWRPFWAMVVGAPFAAWLRGVWLNAPILPVFVPVLGGVAALALLAWRTLFMVWISRWRLRDG